MSRDPCLGVCSNLFLHCFTYTFLALAHYPLQATMNFTDKADESRCDGGDGNPYATVVTEIQMRRCRREYLARDLQKTMT
ncbi:hypothetical protein N665_0016s0028 [Sinapis alba]|nr:hypothetical protein N665_0016s0028 [Sinapis alba]